MKDIGKCADNRGRNHRLVYDALTVAPDGIVVAYCEFCGDSFEVALRRRGPAQSKLPWPKGD